MRRTVLGILLAMVMIFACMPQMVMAAQTETVASGKADRTILLYACGADLESGSGMCTYKLKVNVMAEGNAGYRAMTKPVTVTMKVK